MHQDDDVDPIKMMGDASFTMHVDSTKFRPQNDFMVVFSFSLIFVLFCFVLLQLLKLADSQVLGRTIVGCYSLPYQNS